MRLSKYIIHFLVFLILIFPTLSHADIKDEKYNQVNQIYRREVKSIFQRKCFDCHSNHTKYPWFYNIPIVHSIIDRDIKLGKEKLLYDQDYPFTSDIDQITLLNSIQNVIEKDSMPPTEYKIFNLNKELTAEEKEIILNWIKATRLHLIQFGANELNLGNEPIQPLYAFNLNPKKVELGDQLFHDPRLSANNSISCASCHSLELGGVDRKRVSNGIFGAQGHVNSPTVLNSGFNIKQFWDGRAETLERQIDGPIQNGLEMGSSWEQVVEKLNKEPDYVQKFTAIYADGITRDNIKNAIADFERSLITPSRFDQYLKGETDVLTPDEKEGYLLFKRYGCVACHQGVNVGGNLFEKIGKFGDYFETRGTPIKREDYGRFNVTHKESDKFKFKVPTLRNVELTYPYFHDGSVADLERAIDIMAKHQLGRTLSQRDIKLISAFLKTLTGEEFKNEN